MLLVSSHHGNEVVACACEQAERAGVRAGMTVAHARSLLRGCNVQIEAHSPAEDAQQLNRLAKWALRFSPMAAPDEPDGLLLDITGCAHLYGGESRLAEHLGADLEQLGFDSRLAIAPTFACAQAVSHCAMHRITVVAPDAVRETLAPLPITALRADATICRSLREIGIERIAQLFDLSRAELSARFGNTLLNRMDQALGQGVCEVIEPIRRIEPIEVSHTFDSPVVCLEAVLTTCRDLLSLLLRKLSQQESGVCVLLLSFQRIDSSPIPLSLRLTHPSRDEKHLWSLLLPRLERLHLGYGIEEIHLRVERTECIEHGQIDLWPGAGSRTQPHQEASWSQLLDHVIERLGLENVIVAEPVEAYVPEQTYAFHSWNETDRTNKKSSPRSEGQTLDPAARPSRLFSQPEPIRVMTVTPDGPLVWLHWRGRERRVYRCLGPERISLPWWEAAGACDGSPHLSRDYYMIVDTEGNWLWVFRDGQSGQWFVHGEWA